jgi:hypothetical protein
MCKILFFLFALFISMCAATDKSNYLEVKSTGYKSKLAKFISKTPSPKRQLKRAQTFVAEKFRSILSLRDFPEEPKATPMPLQSSIHNKKKLSEQYEDCPKTKTRITTSTYGSLADLHIIKEYVNAAGGKVMLDTKYHILKIVENPAPCEFQTIYDVKELYYTEGAFTALKNNSTIITFGFEMFGGKGPDVEIEDVAGVTASSRAFAAWTMKGDVYAWGHESFGGDTAGLNLKNIQYVVGTVNAFAALDTYGSIKTWNSQYESRLKYIVHLTSIDESFAALDSRGSVFTWSSTQSMRIFYSVKTLVSTGTEFGVLTNDGYFYSWENDLENKILHERPSDSKSITLKPSLLKIFAYNNGTIRKIIFDTRKEIRNAGITEGWNIATINYKPFSNGLLAEVQNGTKKYILEFVRPTYTLVDNVQVKFNGFWIQYEDGVIRLV